MTKNNYHETCFPCRKITQTIIQTSSIRCDFPLHDCYMTTHEMTENLEALMMGRQPVLHQYHGT